MEISTAARVLIGDSLGFHILFALLSVGLPLLMSIFEFYAIRRDNPRILAHVRLWSRLLVILVVVGVISGTLIAVQLSLLWPHFMQIAGEVVGPAFMFEGYFFLLEAVFLAFYLSTWDRVSPMKHWLLGLPIFIGAAGSAVVITMVNAWMSEPRGFDYVNGEVANVDTMAALFTWTSFYKITHSVLSYITVTALVVGSLYAIAIVARRTSAATRRVYELIAVRVLGVAVIFALATMLLGHLSAVFLVKTEPLKLAAFEIHYRTGADAPLIVGGNLEENPDATGGEPAYRAEGGVEIPGALSMLAGNSLDRSTVVQGLEDTPREFWPPLVVHTLFDIKIALAVLVFAIPIVVVFLRFWRHRADWIARLYRLSWWLVIPSGLIGVAVVEIGWVMAEVGRQPWAIQGILLTRDSFTDDPAVISLGYAFPITFVLLLVTLITAVWFGIIRWNPERERGKS